MDRKYIGVDLGAWYNKNNKTGIAIGIDKGGKLHIEKIVKEYTKQNSDIQTIHQEQKLQKILNSNGKQVLNNTNWNLLFSDKEKNDYLVEYLLSEAKSNAMIGIDAPFAIPAKLKNIDEEPLELHEDYQHLKQLKNPYLFDNSARFVLNKTTQTVLAPCATLVGSLTARMVHISDNYFEELSICKDTELKENFSTVEVYPRATLQALLKDKKIPPYKDDNWMNMKDEMLELLKEELEVSEEIKCKIVTDDDYDAVICALTVYLIDKYGYEKPAQKDINKFTNSFIYIPKIKS